MIVRNFVKMHHYETSNRPSICVVDKFLSRSNFSDLSEFAEECGVIATPTLVAIQDGKVVARMAGSNYMESKFFKKTIAKHSKVK